MYLITWNNNTGNRNGDPYDNNIEKLYKHKSQGNITCMCNSDM